MQLADGTHKTTSLGTCCICGVEGPSVRTIALLNAKIPIRGHGWGCVQCDLPPHGASAVVCDACVDTYGSFCEDHLRFACRGYPGTEGRLPIEDLRGEHGHNPQKHPELPDPAPLTILATDTRFPTHIEEGQGCHCSRCGQTIWKGVGAFRAFEKSGASQYRYHPTCFGCLDLTCSPP